MSQTFVLKKGLNIPIAGEAELRVSKTIAPGIVAVQPTDFKGFLPRLLVKEGDPVLCGSPVAADKKNADILLTSPVSGTVKEIVRGEKRKLLAILIESDGKRQCVDFGAKDASQLDAAQVREALLQSGLWPWLIQRPYGILANPEVRPRDIFVSTFSTAPLSADAAFCFGSELAAAQAGICALTKLTDGKVYVGLDGNKASSAFAGLKHCELNTFRGPHPAGNVGVQISHIAPIRKEDTVWTVSLAGLVAIGKLFTTGKYDVRRKVAVTGPMALQPSYVDALPGTPMQDLAAFFGNTPAEPGHDPARRHRPGAPRLDPSFPLQPVQRRPQLLLLAPAEEEVRHEHQPARRSPRVPDERRLLCQGPPDGPKFGIYEVLPEDLATCEFVDPSKNNIQAMIEQGINLMLKEMA